MMQRCVGGSTGAELPAAARRTPAPGARSGRRKTRTLQASPEESNKKSFSFRSRTWDFYRPLKKPVTLRLDADVLAWFKKDGSRYQTRINRALRKVMEREIKAEGEERLVPK